MATYTRVSRLVPDDQRVVQITEVGVGDQLDFVDILGRPARRLIMNTSLDTDTVGYTLNSLRRLRKKRSIGALSSADRMWGVYDEDEILVWSGAGDEFVSEGEVIETAEGLKISSIEIDSLTLSGGATTITIVAW